MGGTTSKTMVEPIQLEQEHQRTQDYNNLNSSLDILFSDLEKAQSNQYLKPHEKILISNKITSAVLELHKKFAILNLECARHEGKRGGKIKQTVGHKSSSKKKEDGKRKLKKV